MTATAQEITVSGVPDVVAERLRALYVDHGGTLSERDVLNEARQKSSPLHGYFEWKDSAAAESWRLTQAANLIRRVRVTILPSDESADPIKVRAYVARRELAATAENIEPGTYMAIEDVAGQTAFEVSLRDSIRRDLLRVKRKYENTDLFLQVAGEVASS